MQSRYWVVGGEYTSIAFEALVAGTEKVLGPFHCRSEAERTWRALSESRRPEANVRFTIAREAAQQAPEASGPTQAMAS